MKRKFLRWVFLFAIIGGLAACNRGPVGSRPEVAVDPGLTVTPVAVGNSAAGPRVVVENWQEVAAEAPLNLVVHLEAENIVVRQGGAFHIEVEPGSEAAYVLRDNREIPYAQRYFYYAHWDMVFEHKDKNDPAGTWSETVTITIPESEEKQSFVIKTGNGSIFVEGLRNVNLSLEAHGDIRVENTKTEAITVYRGNRVELLDVTAQKDIEINYQSYYGGDYMTGPNGEHTIILEK